MVTDLSPATALRLKLGFTDRSPTSTELEEAFTNYLLSCRIESKSVLTIETYQIRLGQFIKYTKQQHILRPGSVTAYHIRLFLLSLQERKLEPATLNAFYRTIRAFFNWCAAEGLIKQDKNPMQNIKAPKIPLKLPTPFTMTEIMKLITVASGKRFVDVRNLALVLIFLDTGLRLGEMANLKLKDFNVENGLFKVMGKGAKERLVRLGKKAQKALFKYLLLREDDYDCIWISENRKPLTKYGIEIAIQDLCKRAGINRPHRGPHTFRHTFGTVSLRNKADIREVQTLLGHSTLKTTLLYVSTVGSEDAIKSHCQFSPVDNLKIG